MNEFLIEASKPIFLLAIGVIMGILKAIIRRSPISKKEEFINYNKFLIKPVLWTFVLTFFIFMLIGFGVNPNKIEVFQKSFIAGLYGLAGTYVFMIWGANLIRNARN